MAAGPHPAHSLRTRQSTRPCLKHSGKLETMELIERKAEYRLAWGTEVARVSKAVFGSAGDSRGPWKVYEASGAYRLSFLISHFIAFCFLDA